MTELVRWALSLIERVLEEVEKGNRIVIVNPKGKVEKELVVPL